MFEGFYMVKINILTFGKCVLKKLKSSMSTFSRTAWELGAWQVPCWKLPQVPDGVPKLAKLIAEMDCPGAQCRLVSGMSSTSDFPSLSTCQFSMLGWCSETSAQTIEVSEFLVTDLFTIPILDTSPPISSKTTSKFLVCFNHERGIWYLKTYRIRWNWASYVESFNLKFYVIHGWENWDSLYHCWVGWPQPNWHFIIGRNVSE